MSVLVYSELKEEPPQGVLYPRGVDFSMYIKGRRVNFIGQCDSVSEMLH